eukprot:6844080-Pyramimonas_sp.AAC.1
MELYTLRGPPTRGSHAHCYVHESTVWGACAGTLAMQCFRCSGPEGLRWPLLYHQMAFKSLWTTLNGPGGPQDGPRMAQVLQDGAETAAPNQPKTAA